MVEAYDCENLTHLAQDHRTELGRKPQSFGEYVSRAARWLADGVGRVVVGVVWYVTELVEGPQGAGQAAENHQVAAQVAGSAAVHGTTLR